MESIDIYDFRLYLQVVVIVHDSIWMSVRPVSVYSAVTIMLLNEKYPSSSRKSRVLLTDRPFDLVYFVFFVVCIACLNGKHVLSHICAPKVHIIATLCLDLQPLYPSALVPSFMSEAHKSYVKNSSDPLIKAFIGLSGQEAKLSASWFETFIYCEA